MQAGQLHRPAVTKAQLRATAACTKVHAPKDVPGADLPSSENDG
jgi:hypothetical protein